MGTNQKGFSAIEVLLIVVIVSLLSLAGWFVWRSDNNAKNNYTDTEVSESKNDGLTTKQSTIEAPAGWTTYSSKNLGYSFAYPETWAFEDKSDKQLVNKTYFIGELTPDDKSTTIAITLVRKKDGRNTHSTIEEWRAYAAKANIQYRDLADIGSRYTAFRYIYVLEGATGLVYDVLETNNNVHLIVLPTDTKQIAIIDQVVSTLNFEE